jgi:hypothetical protein
VTSLVGEGGTCAHLTVMVIVARRACLLSDTWYLGRREGVERSLGRHTLGLRAIVHTTRILARGHKNRVVGMCLRETCQSLSRKRSVDKGKLTLTCFLRS